MIKKSVWGVFFNPSAGYLFLRRSKHASSSKQWNFPGGGVEKNEDPSVALLRELREEIGYQGGMNIVPFADHYFGSKQFHYYACVTPAAFQPVLNMENDKSNWTMMPGPDTVLHEPTRIFIDFHHKKFMSFLRQQVDLVTAAYTPRTEIRYDTRPNDGSVTTFLLAEDGKVLGSGCVWPHNNRLYNFHIKPEYRGMGLSHRLMEGILAGSLKPTNLEAEPYREDHVLDMEALVAFYEKWGFRRVRTNPDKSVFMTLDDERKR